MDWQDEVEWCLRLWNSLRVRTEDTPGGEWTLEKGEESSLFDHHDYLATLAREIGWEMYLDVKKAKTHTEEFMIPEDRIGDVTICSKKCGTVARIEPITVDQQYYKLTGGMCPVCGEKGFTKDWHNLHVVIDDRGAALRSMKQEEE